MAPLVLFDPRRRLRVTAALFVLALSAFRLWYAAGHGLAQDEAYYWLWARHLSPGYYDQGPGVALAIRWGLLFGDSTAAIRLPAVIDASITSVLGYLIASRIFGDERAGFGALVFLNVVPLLFVGGILITHDSPQAATWTAALYCLARALGVERSAGWRREAGGRRDERTCDQGARDGAAEGGAVRPGAWWMATGMLAGLSMDCKFTALLFFPCLLLLLLVTDAGRAALRTPWPYVAVACAVVVFVPPIVWNATHSWASARHILNLGVAAKKRLVDPSGVVDFLSGQLAVTLLFFFTLGWASIRAWLYGRREKDVGLILCGAFSWPIWTLFFLLSFHGTVEANWPVPAYLSAAIVAPWLCFEGYRAARGPKQRWIAFFHLVSMAIAAVGMTFVLFPQLVRVLAPGGHLDAWRKMDRTNEMAGWDQLAEGMERVGWTPHGPWRAAAVRYQDAAELAFALPGHPTTYNLPVIRRHDQFDFWPAMAAASAAIVAVQEKDTRVYDPQLRAMFTQVLAGPTVPIWRRPAYVHPIASYRLFLCLDYHGGRRGLVPNAW